MAGLLWMFSSSGSLGSRARLSKDKQLAEPKLEQCHEPHLILINIVDIQFCFRVHGPLQLQGEPFLTRSTAFEQVGQPCLFHCYSPLTGKESEARCPLTLNCCTDSADREKVDSSLSHCLRKTGLDLRDVVHERVYVDNH